MSRAERDARRKLLMLQGALYRLEIIQARVALRDAAKPKAVGGQLFGLLKFVLARFVCACGGRSRLAIFAAPTPLGIGAGLSCRCRQTYFAAGSLNFAPEPLAK